MDNDTTIPFDDDEPQAPLNDSRQSNPNLSLSNEDDSLEANPNVGGLEEEEEEEVASTKKRKAEKPKKARKRRKIVIDDDKTELSNQHIHDMLADTSDIVRQDDFHPATWVPGMENQVPTEKTDRELLYTYLSYEKLFTRPSLGDDGLLAPELLALWARNAAPVLGKPFPYKMRDAAAPQEEEEESDQEVARQEESIEGEQMEVEPPANDFSPQPPQDDDEFPPQDDDEQPVPFDDDDAMAPAMDDSGYANEMEDAVAKSKIIPDCCYFSVSNLCFPDPDSPASLESTLTLGLVNDFETMDDEDEPRQQAGDELVSSSAKWHRHTTKVYTMLKDGISSPEDPNKPNQLSYLKISKGVSRRTAAGVFFELLQLKTWDFIELEQDESYGDIQIAAGVRFNEPPPSG
jgi:hypothetical protein